MRNTALKILTNDLVIKLVVVPLAISLLKYDELVHGREPKTGQAYYKYKVDKKGGVSYKRKGLAYAMKGWKTVPQSSIQNTDIGSFYSNRMF